MAELATDKSIDHWGIKLFAVALISLAGLALEIGLTRLVSVLFFPPAVFAILSLAILGIGLGAAWVTWRPNWRNDALIPFFLCCAALSVAAIAILSTIPSLQIALFVVVVLPYLFIGMTLTTLFSLNSQGSSQLYFADLVGAGLGALLAIPIMNWFGGLNGIMAMAVLLAFSALIWRMRRPGLFILLVSIFTMAIFAGNLFFDWLIIDMANLPAEKPISESLTSPNSRIIDTRWNAFSRTDLVDPGDGGPFRVYMDGAAGSIMPPAENNEFLWQDIGFFPFATEQPQRVFLIGPGGGLDVWFGLQSGAEEITGIEVNQASVDLVNAYKGYNGGVYEQPHVEILIDDGRSVLRRDETLYDLIFLSQLVTLTTERTGYTLVENGSYTVEAFTDYLNHLKPRGQLAIKLYDEPTLTRALSTALAAFRRQGLSDREGMQHIIALLDSQAQPPIPLLIVSKDPFSEDDVLSIGAVARQVGFSPLFLPGAAAQPPLDDVAAGNIAFLDVVASSENDLSPTTDNRPFFYQFERGVPQALQPLLWAAAAGLLFGGLILFVYQRRSAKGRLIVLPTFYFAALGLGFILVEIGVIQQTRLFLGHPITATTTVLATLLISGGLGSALAGRWFKGQPRFHFQPVLAVLVILIVWLLLWPWIMELTQGAQLIWRLLAVSAGLLPLGLFMGMPFPLGLKAVGTIGSDQVALAWTVNGFLSVGGSILAVTLAILFGFSAVLLIGGLAYGLVLLAAILPLGLLEQT